jgi:hypothetical protein
MKFLSATLILLALAGCGGLPSQSASFQIKVTGSDSFSGCISVMRDGKMEQRTVDGSAPTSYSEQGMSVSAVLQKKSEHGRLKAEIIRDGQVVSSQETTAEYGVVTVSSGL